MDKIKVYGADWCADCHRTKKLLESQKISYEYLDVEKDPRLAEEAVEVSGSKAIPVVVLPDTTVLVEPGMEELSQKLSLLPKANPADEKGEENLILYDVAIFGGGPAGVAAGVYCARKKLKTLFITESFGGQSGVSAGIENWIGEKNIAGWDLAAKLEAHVKSYRETVDFVEDQKVVAVKEVDCRKLGNEVSSAEEVSFFKDDHRRCDFEIKTSQKDSLRAKAVIVASGARRRRLGIPGEDQFEGKGVAFCSTCDAPLFKDKVVAVIGGGNAGLEAAIDLFAYAQKIYLLEFGPSLRGDAVTVEEVSKNSKMEIILNAQTKEILGEKFVTGLKYLDRQKNQERTLPLEGVFVEIGSVPNSEMVKDLVEVDKYGQIVIDAFHAATSHPGIFAAGDVTNDPYKQNNISAGDGVRAALACYAYLQNRKKMSPAEES